MAQQTFAVGEAPRIQINYVGNDLNIQAWERHEIEIESDEETFGLHQEGDLFVIDRCDDDLNLRVPQDALLRVAKVEGDLAIEGVRYVEVDTVQGDANLKDIAINTSLERIDEAIEIITVEGDLKVVNAPFVRVRRKVGSDATLQDVAKIEIEAVGSDIDVQGADTLLVGSIGSDLNAKDITTSIHCGNAGSDFHLQESTQCSVVIGNVGSDVVIVGAKSVQVGSTGSDVDVRDVQGDVQVSHVGSDAVCKGVGGKLRIGSIGGDAVLEGIQDYIMAGSIGGDLVLRAAFPVDTHTRLNVGGDAHITLPQPANLRLRAMVGGDVKGRYVGSNRGGSILNLVYGEGQASLELNVGGDLSIHSDEAPRSSSNMNSGNWGDMGWGMPDLGRELGKMGEELGREMGKIGEELGREMGKMGREMSGAFQDYGRNYASDVAEKAIRKAEERARRAQQRAEEAMQRASEKAAKVSVRINNREWRFDPERLEHLKNQARQAASEGISGAVDAVERAVNNMRGTPPPPTPGFASATPPTPPPFPGNVPPVPPVPPTPPMPPAQPEAQETDSQPEATVQEAAQQERAAKTTNIEQEREAILRMIAEGRISSEEGDMLLEALG